jgi:hypothetical protein
MLGPITVVDNSFCLIICVLGMIIYRLSEVRSRRCAIERPDNFTSRFFVEEIIPHYYRMLIISTFIRNAYLWIIQVQSNILSGIQMQILWRVETIDFFD